MKLLPLKLIQIHAWGRKEQLLITASDMGAHECRVLGWMDGPQVWPGMAGRNWATTSGLSICSFYCMESWPAQQRHWSSVCGDQIKVHAPFQRTAVPPDTLCICLDRRLPVYIQKVREFLLTAAGFAAMPRIIQWSLHVWLLPEMAGAEVLQGRSGTVKQELREQGKRVEILRRSTPLPMSDVPCAPSGDRRQEGTPIFPLNSMACANTAGACARTEQYMKVFGPRMEADISQSLLLLDLGCSAPPSNPVYPSLHWHLRSLLFPRPWTNLALLISTYSFAEFKSNVRAVVYILFMIIQVHKHTSVCLSLSAHFCMHKYFYSFQQTLQHKCQQFLALSISRKRKIGKELSLWKCFCHDTTLVLLLLYEKSIQIRFQETHNWDSWCLAAV